MDRNLKGGQRPRLHPDRVLMTSLYGFNTRFEAKDGTNPKELIAQPHAVLLFQALLN